VREDDVLFSNVRTYLRNVAQVTHTDGPTVASTGFTLLRPKSNLLSRYLYHFVRSDFFIYQVTPEQTGTHYPATSDRVVREQLIPLPDIQTQEVMVRVIDAAEASRRSAYSHIQAAHATIDRYRQSVLTAAYSGRLTADLRGRTDEDADDFPPSWRSVHLAEVIESSFYGPRFSSDTYVPDGIPTIRTTDMDDRGSIQFRDPPKLKLNEHETERLRLRDGDLLVTRTGATIGKCAVYEDSLGPALPSAYLIRFRLHKEQALPHFILLFLLSPLGQAALWQAATATAQPNVNAKSIALIPVALPSIHEQREIVQRASKLLEAAGILLTHIDHASKAVERTSQAILTKAFRGELPLPREAAVSV
jgi:type I restriction enzyme S subunit